MTSAEFIKRQYGNANGETKSLSSIFKDQIGNIYSYGRHYPLLFEIDGVNFVNNTGYSNSTAKHINWARQAEPGAIAVWLDGTNLYTWNNPENRQCVPALLQDLAYNPEKPETIKALKKAILRDLENERVDIYNRMESKTRKNTKLYESLIVEMTDCVKRLELVKGFWGLN